MMTAPSRNARICIPTFFNTFSYGNNKVILREAKSIFELLAEPFEDTCVQILVGAAFVSIGLGIYQDGWRGIFEGLSICIAIVIITAITAVNGYVKEKQF